MKKFQQIVLAVGLVLAVVSCRKSDIPMGGAGNQSAPETTTPFSVIASSAIDDEDFVTTRALFDGVNYYWEQFDGLGLFAFEGTDGDGISPVFENVEAVNNQSGNQQSTTFDGKLKEDLFEEMTQKSHYNYIAYYPYRSFNDGVSYADGKIMGLKLDNEQTVYSSKNYFPEDYDFMFSSIKLAPTIAKLDENVDIGLEFRHLFSALEIEIESQIAGEAVTKIVITAPEGTSLCGGFTLSAKGEVVFTSPSNVLTLHIPDGATEGTSVYAIVNSVNLASEDLHLEVETRSGYRYRCTRSGKNYIAGFIHRHQLLIPQPVVTLGSAYTSYNTRSNELEGNAIYVDNTALVTMPEGYELVNDVVDEAGIRYTRGGSDTYENISVSGVTLNVPFGAGANKRDIPYDQWGQYQVQAYAKIGKYTFVSAPIVAHVTGIPYVQSFVGASSLPAGWIGTDLEFAGYGVGVGDSKKCLILRLDERNTIDSNGKLLTPKFVVPNDTPINVSWISSVYGSNSRTVKLYVTASPGSYTTGANEWTQDSKVTFYNEASWATPNPAKNVLLTTANGYVSFTVKPSWSALITGTGYMRFREISVKY